MKRTLFNIACGDRVAINNVVYTLDAMVPTGDGKLEEPDDFQFRDIRIGRVTSFTAADFMRLYEEGRVRLLSPTETVASRFPSRQSAKPNDPIGDDRAAAMLDKAHRRFRYTRAYDEAPVPLSTRSLTEFIQATAERLNDEAPPSPGSLRRWVKSRGVSGARRLVDMVGRHIRGSRGSRLHPVVQQIMMEEAERYYDSIRVSPQQVWHRVADRVNTHNAADADGSEPLSRPAESTVWRWLKDNLDFDRAKRRWGAQEAVRRFGIIKGSMSAEALLDIAVIDHTILDCWIVDDRTLQPIGRPRLTVIMDSCTRMVLGFDLGWADAGLDAVLAALRHAVRPKTYLKTEYPDIEYDWPAYGQPRTVVPDQGLEFMGTTFEDVCASLGISIEPAPARNPEYKGEIERFFGTLNRSLLHQMPGSVPMKPHQLREFGIDPEKTAVFYLSDAIEMIHRWIVTIYAREVHSALGKAPLKAWLDRAKTDIIELCPNLEELDRACGRIKVVRLTREGIRMHRNLVYRCPELAALREDVAKSAPQRARSKQGGVSVKVTYHSNDLSKIYVWNPRTNTPLEVPSITPRYTRGLSEQLHHRILEFTDAANAAFQTEAEMVANRAALYRRMEEICETRVRDRKRLQKVRQPERDAQRGLVRLEAIDRTGTVQSQQLVEVPIHTVANRDFFAPRESRPLLRPTSRKAKKVSRQSVEASATSAVPRPGSQPPPAGGGFNYTSAVSVARKGKGGVVDGRP